MNKTVEEIIKKNKAEFLNKHDLYEKEYAPYLVQGEGYDIGDKENKNPINFSMETTKIISVGDTISVKTDSGKKNIKVSNCEYFLDETLYRKFPYDEADDRFPNGVRVYRKNPMDITDEEYQLLRQELDKKTYTDEKPPALTKILYAIGALSIICGIIMLFVALSDGDVGLGILSAACALEGLPYFAFGKIIDLLQNILRK